MKMGRNSHNVEYSSEDIRVTTIYNDLENKFRYNDPIFILFLISIHLNVVKLCTYLMITL